MVQKRTRKKEGGPLRLKLIRQSTFFLKLFPKSHWKAQMKIQVVQNEETQENEEVLFSRKKVSNRWIQFHQIAIFLLTNLIWLSLESMQTESLHGILSRSRISSLFSKNGTLLPSWVTFASSVEHFSF